VIFGAPAFRAPPEQERVIIPDFAFEK